LRPSIRGTLVEIGDLNLKLEREISPTEWLYERKSILTKNYEIYFSMTTSDVPWEPILPYNHITPIWEGA
jgi:hypothetical protein